MTNNTINLIFFLASFMKIPCSVFNVCSNCIVLKVSVQSGCCLVCENAHNCKIVMVSPEKNCTSIISYSSSAANLTHVIFRDSGTGMSISRK